MKNVQRGFFGIILFIIATIAIIGGGAYLYTENYKSTKVETEATVTSSDENQTVEFSSLEEKSHVTIQAMNNTKSTVSISAENEGIVRNICSTITAGITTNLEMWGFEVITYINKNGEIGGYSATATKASGGTTYYYDKNGTLVVSASAFEMANNEALAESVVQWQNSVEKFTKEKVDSCLR